MDETGRGGETNDPTAGETAGAWSVRRRTIVAAAAIALAALAFLAGSGTLSVPFGGGGTIDVTWVDADVVAADEDGDVRAQVMLAEADEGGCVRVSVADGDSSVVSDARCGDPLSPWDDPDFAVVRLDDYFGSLGQYPLPRTDGSWRVALAGSVHPDVVRVTAHLGDGTEYSFVTRNPGGWFVALVPVDVADPAVATGLLVNAPVRLELFDADGTRVASVDLTTVIGRTPGAA